MKEIIIKHFTALGLKREQVIELLNDKKDSTIEKLSKNLPPKDCFDKWCKAPKTLNSLRKIKLPQFCGWTTEEIINAMTPYINKLSKKFKSVRYNLEDCQNNGCIGVIHALRTDAGLIPFASHAFSRIKTEIRRPSATSGIISKPERMPSKTEVRRAITDWYLNNELISESDLIEIPVQKIGKKFATEKHVPGNLRVKAIPIDLCSDLYDFLQNKFKCQQLPLDYDRVHTISDLIQWIASPPDFNGMPVSLFSSQGNEDNQMVDYVSTEQAAPCDIAHKNHIVKILIQISEEKLTPTQRIVFEHSYGLCGKEIMDNHEIADSFSKLTGGNNISRQRVTQYSKVIMTKMRKGLLDVFRSDIEDRYYEKTGDKLSIDDIDDRDKLSIMEEVLCNA